MQLCEPESIFSYIGMRERYTNLWWRLNFRVGFLSGCPGDFGIFRSGFFWVFIFLSPGFLDFFDCVLGIFSKFSYVDRNPWDFQIFGVLHTGFSGFPNPDPDAWDFSILPKIKNLNPESPKSPSWSQLSLSFTLSYKISRLFSRKWACENRVIYLKLMWSISKKNSNFWMITWSQARFWLGKIWRSQIFLFRCPWRWQPLLKGMIAIKVNLQTGTLIYINLNFYSRLSETDSIFGPHESWGKLSSSWCGVSKVQDRISCR